MRRDRISAFKTLTPEILAHKNLGDAFGVPFHIKVTS